MTKRNVIVDVEADGPYPGDYSIVCLGAVCVEDLENTFYTGVAPISVDFIPEALAVSGFSRKEHESFPLDAEDAMYRFSKWLNSLKDNRDDRLVFWSDNLAFDWQWINYYLHKYVGKNPFGHSGRRIGDLYAGLRGNPNDHTSLEKI